MKTTWYDLALKENKDMSIVSLVKLNEKEILVATKYQLYTISLLDNSIAPVEFEYYD